MNAAPAVHMIPVEQIEILNSRERNRAVFQRDIVENIAHIGLKKPVTVSRRENGGATGKPYNLVCGQGRLEACIALGEKEIPAIVLEASEEDCLIMSLVENLHRRQVRPVELMREIGALKERGYANAEIARKTDLDPTFVGGVVRLLERGEDGLVGAVSLGKIPIGIAVKIAAVGEQETMNALQQLYEAGECKEVDLAKVKRVLERRVRWGKAMTGIDKKSGPTRQYTPESLMRVFQEEAERLKLTVRRGETIRNLLLMITSMFDILTRSDHFVTLLRAEGLDSMPNVLLAWMREHGRSER
ncbi:MAG: ParB N-terminal domain-containing protein [Magnetococcales bacterium]|nr:ParB N-terminal domain-containing protein [Magnetococcales bacterium]